jgi:hypothetical protein
MLVIPVPIPDASLPLPDPTDKATFTTRKLEQLRWANEDLSPGAYALASASYENAVYSESMAGQALSSANFKGSWSSLTGALNIPASVYHSSRFWILLSNLADVTTDVPGVSGLWVDVTNILQGVNTASGARAALDVYSKAETAFLPARSNLIVNGDGRVNQSGYVSGATGGTNNITLDRWRVFATTYGLTFSTLDNRRLMTIGASPITQNVMGSDIVGGDYVINWTGTATCSVNGGPPTTKGTTFSLTAGSNVDITFTSGTFTDVQLERGTVPTPFQTRPYAEELALCKFYYERIVGVGALGTRSYGTAADSAFEVLRFAPKKSVPTITKVGTWSVTNCGQPTITDVTDSSCIVRSTVTATGTYSYSTGSGQGIEIDTRF